MIEPLEDRRHLTTTGLDPTYGNAGTASAVIAAVNGPAPLTTDIVNSGFAASGAGYIEVRQTNPSENLGEQDYQDRYLLYHINADGTFDSSFGTNGRVELKTPGDIIFMQSFAVSPTGRLVVNDSTGAYRVFDANGNEQYGAGNRLTRTVRRLTGDYQTRGKHVLFSKDSLAFDAKGRLLIPGQLTRNGNAVAIFRFTTYGYLDETFGNYGRGFTRLTSEHIDYDATRLTVSRDGQINYLGTVNVDIGPTKPGIGYYIPSDLIYATLSADGDLIARGRYAKSPVYDYTQPSGGSGTSDARALADGSIAVINRTATLNQLSFFAGDGSVGSKTLGIEPMYPTRLTPSAALRGWVGGTDNGSYPALEGKSDRFQSIAVYESINRPLTVLGDGSLIAAGIDKTASTPTILVQKFDGTGLDAPAAGGSAVLQPNTRTLDVRGTGQDDVITIRKAAKLLRVTINGVTTSFARSEFDTLHVSAGSGNDTVSVSIGRADLAVRLRGDAGDDQLITDAWRATVDGGTGNDVSRQTPGSELQIASVEAVRHPPRQA